MCACVCVCVCVLVFVCIYIASNWITLISHDFLPWDKVGSRLSAATWHEAFLDSTTCLDEFMGTIVISPFDAPVWNWVYCGVFTPIRPLQRYAHIEKYTYPNTHPHNNQICTYTHQNEYKYNLYIYNGLPLITFKFSLLTCTQCALLFLRLLIFLLRNFMYALCR